MWRLMCPELVEGHELRASTGSARMHRSTITKDVINV
jgi:hypothetical protein